MTGLIVYLAVTIIPWVGLLFRFYDICKGNYDPSEDPKLLFFLGLWAIGFTILWIAIGGFGNEEWIEYKGFWFVD